MRTIGAILTIAAMTAGAASAGVVGPSPYLGVADSPFATQTFSIFVLEDFDGAPQAGYQRSGGIIPGPGALVDSVGGA